ncbi:MAG: polysaccharide deacetylase family protein, partial [Deltaproteobacteria bacterium]|nr:polysaccharide deacetylase family protein [Deltaproteobacteria bacterium]
MKTRIHRVCRAGFTASRLAFFLIILAALSSCATHQSAQASSGHLVFRSDEYIICKLKSNETPDALAGRFLNDTQKSWIIEDANEGARFTTGETIVIPLQQENIGGVMANGYQTVPVVGYNQFSEDCEGRSSCITTHVFEQQMKYLQDNGYRVIAMNKFLDFLYYRGAIPKRSVVITIDGNHKSAYDIAYPILKKYAYPSTIFIYPDTIGTEETSLTWDQLKQLMADGFEVGCFAFSNKE